MAWVWQHPSEDSQWGASIDYEASAPADCVEYLADGPVDANLRPVFRSKTGIRKFKQMHCPPFGQYPAIDQVWKDIILRYVPADRVQFLPVRLIVRGEICDDFMWVIPFDRVLCIDKKKSEITSKIEKPDLTLIFGIKRITHFSNCLGERHLARDLQMISHMIVSNELKEALMATGESSMFCSPEDVITLDNMFAR